MRARTIGYWISVIIVLAGLYLFLGRYGNPVPPPPKPKAPFVVFVRHMSGWCPGQDGLVMYLVLEDDGSFFRFSITEDNTLMAEYKDGFEWWVVGRIDDPSNLGLPRWRTKYRALLDGQEVILVDEVAYSCGDELTLRDGRKARCLR